MNAGPASAPGPGSLPGGARTPAAPRWRRFSPRKALAVAYIAAVFSFLLAPLVVVVGGSFSAPVNDLVVMSYVQFPPERLTLKWYRGISSEQLHALGFSFALGLCVALTACIIGVPAALGLVRGRFRGKALVGILLRAPLQIPHVVLGIAFLQLYYTIGDLSGVYIDGTLFGLFVGHVFLATPFVIGSVGAVLLRFNVRLEEAAFILGATQWRTLRRVTLPVILPGIFSGGLYAFIASFVDVPVAIFLSAPGLTTYPVELFHTMEQDFNPTSLASASLAALFALIVLIVAQRIVGLDSLLRAK
ncbi:MAG: ABC transporter permease [Burkholderiales bacterium]|nr:ABC transporter permease [Burkholderiales bacterium]